MRSRLISISVALFLLTIIFIGCSKDKMNATAPEQTAAFSVNPADQQQNVRLDEKIVLTFAKPVDPKTVESGFHLISQSSMADSTCQFSKTMNHGDMTMAMMDTMKMNHLDQNHSMKGKFSWNSNNTQCVFTPDSIMTPKMVYMMHISKNMMEMMNQKMGDMGGMMNGGSNGGMMGGNGSGQLTDHMLMHFTTMDTSNSSGGGHLGHH